MNARAQVADHEFATLLQRQARTSLLRFIACGSVDHGKSTLIGRLLYETKQLFDDQLATLAKESRKFGTQGGELDFSLLLDGLAAEREQKITIDVAYRFFATARRKFIVIDAPGHEQYTANMATGASVAELALILVSADEGITRQTKRHAVVLSMLGVRNIVLAINKMDRVGWSEVIFRGMEAQFRDFAAALGVDEIVAIPLAAKTDVEITLLANLLTLTPGSVSLDVSSDRRFLYLHAMYIDDVDEYRESVKNTIEKRVLEVLR